MKDDIKRRIDLAAGRKRSQLVLKNAQILNVFSHEIISGDIAIDQGKIVGIGNYNGLENIDLEGKVVVPGLIDGHVHMESAMVTPGQFARAIVPRGTTTIVADPHEIANVCGIPGIEYMLKASEGMPLNVYMMLPSCVPATSFENAGANLKAKDLAPLINHEKVLGLGELMDYPGVIAGEESIIDKIMIAEGKMIDGHGPDIKEEALNAYVAAGVRTEHECSTVEEMINRLRLGMYILIREGSAARNLKTLVRGITPENMRRCLFCTDDKHPEDILEAGHIDHNVRVAIKEGLDPISAVKMATINAAECYGLKDLGAIAPGYRADLVVLDNLETFHVTKVFKDGKLVAQDGKAFFEAQSTEDHTVTQTVNAKELTPEDLVLSLETDIVNVIKLLPHSLVTQRVSRKVEVKEGTFRYHEDLDILKLAVIERHKRTGNIGLGLVEDFRLKGGAIASTVAHDSHNIIVIGDNDEDMLLAVNELNTVGGGITICSKGEILQTLSLPIAGLMAQGTMEEVNEQLKQMLEIAYKKLGINEQIDPFMTLSFLALPVIPELKLTDLGLFDVKNFRFISLNR
ncbi:adenine deaminase [Alkaliphilus metalliredigens QYMF]|uniref:Adenine deaminase n=1 Tax=Alkaliphilus metalliredigens (strain QYMF) TaxID=293826 RepID=A6TWS0_ALKMQ|nr:adenine deaminase [Alkaliphilus metalliredigens]ABR50638.1 adenine deaminase [Alkaliphilus metalliredigens QYMF]